MIKLSISYLKHRDKNMPGIMISPNPSILSSIYPTMLTYGNCNFKGKSIPLATVTITSDQQTHMRSQRKRLQRMGIASLKVFIEACWMVLIVKQRAKRLFRNQFFQLIYNRARRRASRGQNRYLATVENKFHNFMPIFSYKSHNFMADIDHLCNQELQYRTTRTTKAKFSSVSNAISYEFLSTKYRPSKITHPITGYCKICHKQDKLLASSPPVIISSQH